MSAHHDAADAARASFVAAARAIGLSEASQRLAIHGLKSAGVAERVGPCPACGGKDRFSINGSKNAWNCRGSGEGGRDGIGLAAHVLGLDVRRSGDFLAACSAVLGEAVPDGSEPNAAERAERDARLAARRAEALAKADEADRAAAYYRNQELARCLTDWRERGAPSRDRRPPPIWTRAAVTRRKPRSFAAMTACHTGTAPAAPRGRSMPGPPCSSCS